MYRSYSYNNMPQPIIRHEETPKPSPQPESAAPEPVRRTVPEKQKPEGIVGFLKNLQSDDIILIAVIFALLIDDCDDKLLLIALGFVFFSDMF